MMPISPVLLWSDVLVWGLVVATIVALRFSLQSAPMREAWARVGRNRAAMAACTLLLAFVSVGLLDSLHYRERLDGAASDKVVYGVDVLSALDWLASPLRLKNEKTYSAPLAMFAYSKESIDLPGGGQRRDFPRLKQAGRHLDSESEWLADVAGKAGLGVALGTLAWLCLAGGLRHAGVTRRWPGLAWDAVLASLALLCLLLGPALLLAANYHVLGTDKVGQDVLYQVLKSVRTALIIGLLTTLVTLPLSVVLGIVAGYFRGWVDDLIQFVYTVLNSIPGVLLIAAAVLMMQGVIDSHPDWFATAAERADLRLLALCFILGMTSWTGLCRLLRAEVLKLRELEYVQAAQAFGVRPWRILMRHILPNLMHIVIIALVMDFSGLVLAEAVLSYVGIGVDPTMTSFGTMINNARMELGREPVVWWSLAAAFVAMFTLVLAANLFADAVRDAFDPRAG